MHVFEQIILFAELLFCFLSFREYRLFDDYLNYSTDAKFDTTLHPLFVIVCDHVRLVVIATSQFHIKH